VRQDANQFSPCSLVKIKGPLARALVLNTGGEGGMRLHSAGRGCACKRNPTNPTRKPLACSSPWKIKKPACAGFFIEYWRRGWDSNPRYGKTVRLISSQVHSTTLPPLLDTAFAMVEYREAKNYIRVFDDGKPSLHFVEALRKKYLTTEPQLQQALASLNY
jgi:hypothetical protein